MDLVERLEQLVQLEMVGTVEMEGMETQVHAKEGLEDWEVHPVAMEAMPEVTDKRVATTSHL